MILYFASDLIWATKIKGVADALGIPCRPVRTVDMLDARLADSQPKALLVDLTTPDVALAMITRLRGSPGAQATPMSRPIRIIAFGPHVERDLFQQARDAGADEVLARGMLDRHMDEILTNLAGRA
jgi:CheY-like chemotaxis protein